MTKENNSQMAFWGSSEFSVFCLEKLKSLNCLPALIITTPDQPQGRGLKLEANPVKTWAIQNNIEYLTPAKLDSDFSLKLSTFNFQLFLVASYGKIIPKAVINLPKQGTLNIHPSLLPKYRGPSPLQEQILNDEKDLGVSIMLIDEQVDHGPIIAQDKVFTPHWPVKYTELEKIMAETGAKLFVKILPDWIEGKIKLQEQNHTLATFTKKVEKNDGEIDLITGDPYKNFLKIQAYNFWPQAYFFKEKDGRKIRIIIKDAEFKSGSLVVKRVLPEGKKEMNYEDFLRGFK
jgi:methionyl-tRNA formyltransferase